MSHVFKIIFYAAALIASIPMQSFAQNASEKSEFIEQRISHGPNKIYVRDFPGKEPAYVMVHGFPDNLHIYDQLAPMLAASGHRVIIFDFLGFGNSDKPAGFKYSFEQQLEDLTIVVNELKLKKIIPVAHDAGGPAVINYALVHPERISSIVLLNTIYGNSSALKLPELISLCANPELTALAGAMLSDPKQREWLLTFQKEHFVVKSTQEQKEFFNKNIQPLVNENFASGAGPAFMGMTSKLYENQRNNEKQAFKLKKIEVPVYFIWGDNDPYLNSGVAKELAKLFKKSTIKLLPLGHWPQLDDPKMVAEALNTMVDKK